MLKKIIQIIFVILIIFSSNIQPQEKLHISKFKEFHFSALDDFEIVGNLYFPENTFIKGIIIWVHGDGPDLKTNKFPGISFFNTLLDNGYAYFRYDKPGSGDSKGSFTDSLLFKERAAIVSSAIDVVKDNSEINANKIGLAGSSQAGYVIPLVLQMRNDVDFMIGLSLPAMDGNEQWAYLLKKQMICDGYSKKKAVEFSKMHLKMIRSKTFNEFIETVKYFEENPVTISSLNGYDENFANMIKNWYPLDWTKVQSFNPMEIISKTKIPVLSIYGEKDTQVNPIQGAKEYNKCLQKAGNEFYEVKILPDADHNMSFSKTGCLNEQRQNKNRLVVPGLIETVDSWLIKLNNYFNE